MDKEPQFVQSYNSSTGEPRIRFEWNGKHAEGFIDSNMEFRNAIRKAVLANLLTASPASHQRALRQ